MDPKRIQDLMTPPWLREIDVHKVAHADQRDLAIALMGLLALLDFARDKISKDDWEYMQRQVKELMQPVLR